ncbi:MAG: hypothetical protein IJE40_07310 [Clostridia bacterium]|nr:hypothetical protein [Clostridia bacterium]
MKKENNKKFKLQNFIAILFFMAIGFFCGILMAEHVLSKDDSLFRFVLLFAAMYVVMFLQIIIHEGGHLIFGLLTGYKFVSFRIGSFIFVKTNGKIKLKRMSIAGTGGQCLLSPPEMKEGKIPYVLYNLGGSILNLISALIFIILGIIFKNTDILNIILYMSAIIGLAYALLNGIPMRVGLVDNDGYNTLSISKDPQAMRSLWVQMKISEYTANGIRLKDMPEEWFEAPTDEEMKNSMISVLGVIACNRLMDEQKFAEAETLMEKFLSAETAMLGLHKNLMKCELAFCEMIKDMPDVEKVESLLDKDTKAFMKSMKTFPTVIRTNYAYELLIKKDIPTALKTKNLFEKTMKNYPFTADIESETELIQITETKAIMPLNNL